MSWSDALGKPLKLLLILLLAAALASCSGFRPVYGDASTTPGRYAFAYGDPGSRLDQIIYSELRLRLGPASDDPDAIRVSVSTSAGARGLTRTAVSKPVTTNEMVVNASITVLSPKGEVLFSGVRSASAVYTSVGQVLGDVEGQNEASERAARALADTVRLSVLGALARPQ